jgi:hypothetical protein
MVDVLGPNEKFRDRSYGEWASAWWNWLVSEDPDRYSKSDSLIFLRHNIDWQQEGDNSRVQKSNDHRKKIEVYEGVNVFFPVIEAEFHKEHPHPDDTTKNVETEAHMRYLARRDIDEGGSMGASIKIDNNKPNKIVDDLLEYRAESALFKLRVPRKSRLMSQMEFPLKEGEYAAVTDGVWLLLKSLPKGTYQIDFHAEGRNNCKYSSSYEILVIPKPQGAVKDITSDLLVRE